MNVSIRTWFGHDRRLEGVAIQTLFLFGVDSLTNIVDYGFHVFLGRKLLAGDFAVFQTINSALIVVVTAFGVFQPVVARFVAEIDPKKVEEKGQIFRAYFGLSAGVGFLFTLFVLLGYRFFAGWMNVPPLTVLLSAGVVLLSLMRPVVWGMLQGEQRFVPFGVTRLIYSLGRFVIAIGLIDLGWTVMGAVAALPIGTLISLAVGLVFLGRYPVLALPPIPAPTERIKPDFFFQKDKAGMREGLQLAFYAFIAYAAFTIMLNMDMVYVNRMFSPEVAGAYAAGLLLRRVLLLLPGAVAVVFYPRAVRIVTRGEVPDRLLLIAFLSVGGTILTLTTVYFALGSEIVRVVFGEHLNSIGPLLGWMGLGILGYSLGSIWMNLALATRPAPFVGWLAGVLILQGIGMMAFGSDPAHVVAVFVIAGWGLALGGSVLYGACYRPRFLLQKKSDE